MNFDILPYNDNQWHHVVITGVVGATNANINTSLYIDGVKKASNGWVPLGDIDSLGNHNNPTGNGQAWSNLIDEFVLYPYALTPTQIVNLYNSYNSSACSCSGALVLFNYCAPLCISLFMEWVAKSL